MITFAELIEKKSTVCVVGLGYVGLPLAVALGRHFSVIGFDVSERRIAELAQGLDKTGEVNPADLSGAHIAFTRDPAAMRGCQLIIVAVPTPIDSHHLPDLRAIENSTALVGDNLAKGAVVVYESTVFPGLTEQICLPVLERQSGLTAGRDFFLGYSPERINPGDKVHTLESIVKVVAGQTPEVADLLEKVYGKVVSAGIHKTSSIMVAEAAKVIENTQRDLNIALMNELALIFDRIGLDTIEVLEAAGTKWNFLHFRPGLVGGHCIGVDPYYLTFMAEGVGYHPQVILAGRRINDHIAKHVAEATVKRLIRKSCRVLGCRVGVLGLTFKENVPDLRNSKVMDVVRELTEYQIEVIIHDPMADPDEARQEYGLTLFGSNQAISRPGKPCS
ncbi:MAG: nucleotide sugar dehydrogenase, partial [Desulfovibrionaceae bacterium]|nr:nucleotide sugar dehydrogenase [Desulfovibrionaceae bacterium]